MLSLLALIGLAVLVVVAIILVETENFGIATLTMLASLGLVQWFKFFDVFHYVEHHAVQSILFLVAYVIVGVVWSFVKWFSYLVSYRDKFRELKTSFLTAKNLDPQGNVPDSLRTEFQEHLARKRSYSDHSFYDLERPRASKNKSRIIVWMSLWPYSFIGTVLNDPVRRLFNFLFNWLKSLYQQMADRVFASDVELK